MCAIRVVVDRGGCADLVGGKYVVPSGIFGLVVVGGTYDFGGLVVFVTGWVRGGLVVVVPHGSIFGSGLCLQLHEHSHFGAGQVFPASAMNLKAGLIDWVSPENYKFIFRNF